jgi:hypothetical protein
MHLRPGPPRRLEAHPDLHRLHRGNRHQHSGQPSIELPVPAHVTAQPHHDAAGNHLDFAPERISRLLGCIDAADDLGFGGSVEHPDLRLVGGFVEWHRQVAPHDLNPAQ